MGAGEIGADAGERPGGGGVARFSWTVDRGHAYRSTRLRLGFAVLGSAPVFVLLLLSVCGVVGGVVIILASGPVPVWSCVPFDCGDRPRFS